eukprot:CAMPEP_0115141216 /NCGR_PEP_ID=MMETSP0227-20121206/59412_1 /TAXON_ID=89957 /ORGANISM="Polarella glacialis, Strain CCMP 1383" /LENGTH=52 /DNA_ID=CAMNT_0002549549 /DNA_START=693 /DNA_END=851 /DNA_ORIENTATION=+
MEREVAMRRAAVEVWHHCTQLHLPALRAALRRAQLDLGASAAVVLRRCRCYG